MRKVIETIYCDLCHSPIEEFKLIKIPQITKNNQIEVVEKEICYNCCNKIINFFNDFNTIQLSQNKQLQNNNNNNNNNDDNNNNDNNNNNQKEINIAQKTATTEENSLRINKKLFVPTVDIQLPTLNKEPNFPIPDKWPDTKIFLSGIGHAKERAINREFKIPYVLDSIIDFPLKPSKLVKQYFDYIKSNNIEYLIDSGAFTYIMNPKKSIDLNEYLKKYCFYINEFDIQLFFELDLDVFLTIKEIENIRRKIFLETHKKPIIVYHDERGHDYWLNMCKENDYVAIGGMVSEKAYTPNDYKNFSILCDEAHQYNTLVHGLGCTPLSLLNSHTMFFDTVDSTTWNFSKRGYAAKVNAKGEMTKAELPFSYLSTESQENDLREWAKFITNYRGGPRK